MERKLSSRLVPVLKWILPPLWVVCVGGAVLTEWPQSTALAILLVGGWVVSSAIVLAVAVSLKEVSLRGDRLVIRRGGSVAEVAADHIREVAADYSAGAWVVVRVDPPCVFGARVSFIAPIVPPWRASRVVAELRALASRPSQQTRSLSLATASNQAKDSASA